MQAMNAYCFEREKRDGVTKFSSKAFSVYAILGTFSISAHIEGYRCGLL